MQSWDRKLATAFPWALAAVLVASMLVPSIVGPGMILVAGLLFGGAVAVAGGRRKPQSNPDVTLFVAGAVATLLWFGFTSTQALNPGVSFLGMVGQHNGTALWLLGLVWLVAGIVSADAAALRLTLKVVASAGGVYALAAIVELVSQGAQRTQGYAAGFFDNSSSLGQFLAVSMMAAAAWGLSEKSRTQRWIAWGLFGLSGIDIALASSRTGMLAVAVGAAVSFLMVSLPDSRRARGVTTAALTLGPGVVTALLVTASTGSMGGAAQSAVAIFGTDRDAIWNAAVSKVGKAPVLGQGLQQFSGWITWGAEGGLPTTDPHNIMLALLLGGGVFGVVLAGATFAALTWTILGVATRSHSLPLALTMASPIALLAAGLVGWIAPAALVAACAMTGTGLGVSLSRLKGGPAPGRDRNVLLVAAIVIGITSIAAAMIGLRMLPTQMNLGVGAEPASMAQVYEQWSDPAYASVALSALGPAVAAGDPQATQLAKSLMAASANDARWRVDVAGAQLILAQTLNPGDPAQFQRFEDIVDRGVQADPRSGLWYVLAAREASRLGLEQQSREYAEKALTLQLDESTRLEMQGLAGAP